MVASWMMGGDGCGGMGFLEGFEEGGGGGVFGGGGGGGGPVRGVVLRRGF